MCDSTRKRHHHDVDSFGDDDETWQQWEAGASCDGALQGGAAAPHRADARMEVRAGIVLGGSPTPSRPRIPLDQRHSTRPTRVRLPTPPSTTSVVPRRRRRRRRARTAVSSGARSGDDPLRNPGATWATTSRGRPRSRSRSRARRTRRRVRHIRLARYRGGGGGLSVARCFLPCLAASLRGGCRVLARRTRRGSPTNVVARAGAPRRHVVVTSLSCFASGTPRRRPTGGRS